MLAKTVLQVVPVSLCRRQAGWQQAAALALDEQSPSELRLPAIAFLVLRLSAVNLSMNATMLLVLAVAAFGYYLPNGILDRLIFYRQRSIFENFPDAADLMLVCVESGLGLDAALTKVAEEMRLKSEAMAEELQLVNLEMRAGSTREKALRTWCDELSIELEEREAKPPEQA